MHVHVYPVYVQYMYVMNMYKYSVYYVCYFYTCSFVLFLEYLLFTHIHVCTQGTKASKNTCTCTVLVFIHVPV